MDIGREITQLGPLFQAREPIQRPGQDSRERWENQPCGEIAFPRLTANMADPYTIRIFVADGDPEGLRIIDQLSWTGLGSVFPRQRWATLKSEPTYQRPGVYLLWGFVEEDDLPTLYIGQGDCIRDRIDDHFKKKEFWQYAVAFTSNSQLFHSTHAQWIEFALVREASSLKQCHLDNGNQPQEPAFSRGDKQDALKFFQEIVKILPLVGLRALEKIKPIIALTKPVSSAAPGELARDTILVPANPEGFKKVFLGENCWYQIRIAGDKLNKIKWIAAYVTHPVKAITHAAPIKHIEPYGEAGKFKVVFNGAAHEIGPIPFVDAPQGTMQASRYCLYTKLMTAKKLMDVF